jgi:hypothetical protein
LFMVESVTLSVKAVMDFMEPIMSLPHKRPSASRKGLFCMEQVRIV